MRLTNREIDVVMQHLDRRMITLENQRAAALRIANRAGRLVEPLRRKVYLGRANGYFAEIKQINAICEKLCRQSTVNDLTGGK